MDESLEAWKAQLVKELKEELCRFEKVLVKKEDTRQRLLRYLDMTEREMRRRPSSAIANELSDLLHMAAMYTGKETWAEMRSRTEWYPFSGTKEWQYIGEHIRGLLNELLKEAVSDAD